MRSLSVRLLASLMLLLPAYASAGQKVDIYNANVLVKSQAESERNAAARASFGELIVRVSGQRSALEHPVIRQALPKAQNYLFGFTYKSTTEKITEDGKSLPALALQLNYDPRAIDQLLREAQLPLWPSVRPKILVWLVYKDSTGLHQLPQPTDLQAMRAQAHYRGLPLTYPKLDLEDSLSLTADDLWNVDLEKIKSASVRYKADAILVGRYTPTSFGPIPAPTLQSAADDADVADHGASSSSVASVNPSLTPADSARDAVPAGPWMGDWHLVHGDNQQSFNDETPEVAGLFSSAIDRAADYFANQYAITPTNQGPQTFMLRIGNITDFGAFKQAQRYLDELAMVQRVEVANVNADGLLVRLTVEGDVKLLMSTLALGRRLAPLQSDSLGSSVQVASAELMPLDTSSSSPAGTSDIDAEAMAELEEALANERFPGESDESDAPQLPTGLSTGSQLPTAPQLPAHAGTADDPLIYVWQK